MEYKKSSLNLTALDVVAATILIYAVVLALMNIKYVSGKLSKINISNYSDMLTSNNLLILVIAIVVIAAIFLIDYLAKAQKNVYVPENQDNKRKK